MRENIHEESYAKGIAIDGNLDNYDITAERNVLRNLIAQKDAIATVLVGKQLSEDHFVDIFHKDVYRSILKYYLKYSTLPTYERLIPILVSEMTVIKEKYETKKRQAVIWKKSLKRIFKKPKGLDKESLTADVDMLETLRKTRLSQRLVLASVEALQGNDLNAIYKDVRDYIKDYSVIDNRVNEGEIIQDLPDHFKKMVLQRNGQFTIMKTGIRGYLERGSKYNLVSLDSLIGGGLYNGEVVLGVGDNNIGKSFFLMETGYNVAKYQKAFVVLFTIEMTKEKQQRRIYSRMTGIPYSKFKKGTLTKKDIAKIKRTARAWKRNGSIFYVVSMSSATVLDIEAKLNELEASHGRKVDLVIIDYLNDMKPIGKFQTTKSWDAMGEISWDLTELSKKWNNYIGIPILTANQKKTGEMGKGQSSLGSAAFSPLPEQHATVVIGLGQDEEDKAIGRIQITIPKSRDEEKTGGFYLYPDFKVSRIYSMKKARKYYRDRKDEEMLDDEMADTDNDEENDE